MRSARTAGVWVVILRREGTLRKLLRTGCSEAAFCRRLLSLPIVRGRWDGGTVEKEVLAVRAYQNQWEECA